MKGRCSVFGVRSSDRQFRTPNTEHRTPERSDMEITLLDLLRAASAGPATPARGRSPMRTGRRARGLRQLWPRPRESIRGWPRGEQLPVIGILFLGFPLYCSGSNLTAVRLLTTLSLR